MKLFNRPQADVATNWKDDPALVKAHTRLSELKAQLDASYDLLYARENAVTAAEAEVNRAELEVLAGRSTDAQLATKQSALIAAKRERAIALIAKEDAAEEQGKLHAALPGIEKKAKLAAKASVQARYLAVARQLKAALEAVAEADTRLVAIQQEAVSQFPHGDQTDALPDGRRDPDLPAAAACAPIGRTRFERQVNLLVYESPSGLAHEWLAQVGEAIAQAEASGGSRPTEKAGGK